LIREIFKPYSTGSRNNIQEIFKPNATDSRNLILEVILDIQETS